VGWAVFTVDVAMQQRIKHLSAQDFMVDQTVQRSKHPNITLFQHWHQWLSGFVTQYWFSMYYSSKDI
jgi:hypothetical protein